jgi:hypothetical protein
MGRSGSSLTARLLNISGLYLGPAEEMMEATDANEKGYWEHLGVYNINVRLLDLFGGSWETPAIFPSGWTGSDAVAPIKEDALALLDTMRTQGQWGWKEPRTTSTLPFWRALVPDLRYVVCLRNPLDVYSSLHRVRLRQSWQYDASFQGTMALWRYYTELALRLTRPQERVIVNYEDYFCDHRKTLEPVWSFLGLDPITAGTPEDEALNEFIEPSLKHSQHTLQDVLAHPYISRDVKQLYHRLLEDRDRLEADLYADTDFTSDASPSGSTMITLLHTIETEKVDTLHDADGWIDPLENRDTRAKLLEEELAQARCVQQESLEQLHTLEQSLVHLHTVEESLVQLQKQNAELEKDLDVTRWQIAWMKSSRGVRMVLRVRTAKAILRRSGPLELTKQMVLWIFGKRG